MADNRTISQLEAEDYPWIGCECCKGTVWVPFRMLRERIPMLSCSDLSSASSHRPFVIAAPAQVPQNAV